jgi:hypothetical protein
MARVLSRTTISLPLRITPEAYLPKMDHGSRENDPLPGHYSTVLLINNRTVKRRSTTSGFTR